MVITCKCSKWSFCSQEPTVRPTKIERVGIEKKPIKVKLSVKHFLSVYFGYPALFYLGSGNTAVRKKKRSKRKTQISILTGEGDK